MHCVSCHAQLAAGSNHCYFCGTVQPATQVVGTAAGNNAWFSTNSSYEGWRIWTSFLLAGLYAPIASSYLLARERAGIAGKALPSPPSNRGLVWLGLFIGLPTIWVLVLALAPSVKHVIRFPDVLSHSRSHAARMVIGNIFIAWFYVFSLLTARRVERHLSLLLYDVTAGSATAVAAFRANRVAQWIAGALAIAPMVVICKIAFITRWASWDDSLAPLTTLYVFAITAASWATSWLHVNPVLRFRVAAVANAP
jgi:hypothetical protein